MKGGEPVVKQSSRFGRCADQTSGDTRAFMRGATRFYRRWRRGVGSCSDGNALDTSELQGRLQRPQLPGKARRPSRIALCDFVQRERACFVVCRELRNRGDKGACPGESALAIDIAA